MTAGPAAGAADADGPQSTVEPSTVEEYQSAILSAITPLAPARLELAAAEGCVLAEDVTAAVALPSFDNSSMDGYAVRAADVAGAARQAPAMLPVAGEIAAGDVGAYRLAPGTVIRIMTGAQLPAGADAVVPVEWTDGGTGQVAVYRPAEPGNAVRYAGGDAAEGETLLCAGTRMRAMQIAAAASAGRKAVTVRPRPRVVVLSTGNELAEPGTPLVPGQIWDSNSYMIAACAREAGAVAYRHSVVPDDPAGVLPALEEQLSRADLLITTGGVSMGGEHNVVKAALRELGTVTFRKVAMQPGMPQGFGVIGKGGVGAGGGEGARVGRAVRARKEASPSSPCRATRSAPTCRSRSSSGPRSRRCRARATCRCPPCGPCSPGPRAPPPDGVPTCAACSTAAASPRCPGSSRTRSPHLAGPTR